MSRRPYLLYVCQGIAASIMGWAAVTKFIPTPGNVYIFAQLEMEPFGRYLVGAIEAVAAMTLLTGPYSAIGALLAVGTLCGAAIAHATYLGAAVQNDSGLHVILLLVAVVTSGYVLYRRRGSLPLIGDTLA